MTRRLEPRELMAIEGPGSPGARPWPESSYQSELEHPQSRVFLWPDAGSPRGFVLWREVLADEAEIMHLAVRDKARGEGSALLTSFLASVEGRRVLLEVAEGNAPAVRLYEKAGFRDVGRRERYYPDGQAARMMVFEKAR